MTTIITIHTNILAFHLLPVPMVSVDSLLIFSWTDQRPSELLIILRNPLWVFLCPSIVINFLTFYSSPANLSTKCNQTWQRWFSGKRRIRLVQKIMILHGNVVSGAYKEELNKSTAFVQRTVYWVKVLGSKVSVS